MVNNTPTSSVNSLEIEINKKVTAVNLEGKKIVWVEDDQLLSDIISRKLSQTKCILFRTEKGEEALKIIDEKMPDVIMLDIILPGMDGFEILRRIKSNPKINRIPVILLSNLSQASDIKKGKSLGAVKFMVKATVTPNDIIEQIKEVLNDVK